MLETEALKQTPLFYSLDEKSITQLAQETKKIKLPKGSVLFRAGDSGDQLYIILSGKIKLGRVSQDGRESLLAILGETEIFGELALFSSGPRTATATAISETNILAINNQSIKPLLNKPDIAASLLKAQAERLRKTNENLADLVFSDVPGRVAKALIDLAERFGEAIPKKNDIYVMHELTQEELAQLVGASRETVNKALAEFTQRNWIKLEAKAVTIVEMSRLTQRAK